MTLNDLEWNDHVDPIACTAKASRRIYLLNQLKPAGIDRKSLIQLILLRMHSFRPRICMQGLPFQLASLFVLKIERVQNRVLRILFPEVSYSKKDAGLKTLCHRREELCSTLFRQIVEMRWPA